MLATSCHADVMVSYPENSSRNYCVIVLQQCNSQHWAIASLIVSLQISQTLPQPLIFRSSEESRPEVVVPSQLWSSDRSSSMKSSIQYFFSILELISTKASLEYSQQFSFYRCQPNIQPSSFSWTWDQLEVSMCY